jgi:hypothetical protein
VFSLKHHAAVMIPGKTVVGIIGDSVDNLTKYMWRL